MYNLVLSAFLSRIGMGGTPRALLDVFMRVLCFVAKTCFAAGFEHFFCCFAAKTLRRPLILFCRRHLRVRVVYQSVRQRHSGRVIIVSCDALLVSGGRLGMPELVSVSDTSILLCRRHLWGETLCTEPNTGLLTRVRLHRWLSGCRCLCHSSGSRVS